MQLCHLLAISALIIASVQLSLPLPLLILQSNTTLPGNRPLNATNAQNPTKHLLEAWPKAPWTFTDLLNDGQITFEYYGRHLEDTLKTRRLIDDGLAKVYQALRDTFDPEPGRRNWDYTRGVVNFRIMLDDGHPATKSEVLEAFFWLNILVGRYRDSPTEINGAVLFVRREIRAHFRLIYPDIAGDVSALREESRNR